MKATKTHISLETAKLLKNCGLKSELLYIHKMKKEDIYEDDLEDAYEEIFFQLLCG